jgi:hypothetical protein
VIWRREQVMLVPRLLVVVWQRRNVTVPAGPLGPLGPV